MNEVWKKPPISLAAYQAMVGHEVGVSSWHLVDQRRIDVYADVIEDHQFIHVDPERAKRETSFGTTVAHGFLTMSLMSIMSYEVMPVIEGTTMGVNYGFDKLRFISPVRAGSRVRGRFTLAEARLRKPTELLSRTNVSVEIEGEEKPALVADWIGLIILLEMPPVMAVLPPSQARGLIPAIDVLFDAAAKEDVDARHRAGHDEGSHIRELQCMTIRFDGRVAIVTGAGNGLGRAHALALASRGAKVVVNDFGGARDGSGGSLTPAETVVEEIRKAGGVAMADGADVSDFEQVRAMVDRATGEWGGVDLLCANAGILRDKSFAKMEIADFARVIDVHLTGTFYCCKAVWNGMRERNYGRIVLTTSSSGLFGNFGQANYGAAKAGMVGLMNVLAEEGRKNNVRVNTISPTAATRMTEELLPPHALELMKPEAISPAVLYLLGEEAPTRTIMGAGAGSFAVIRIMETEGVSLPPSDWTPEAIAAHFAEISDMSKARALESAFQQTQKYIGQAAARAGIKL